jgi:hypothetical protein
MRSVVTQFARMERLAGTATLVAPQPLGFFHTDVQQAARVSPVARLISEDVPLSRLGFSEVYWADIPQLAIDDRHTMDETKAWARTVVSRLRAAYMRAKRQGTEPARGNLDFSMIAEVLDEMIDVINVLENLTFLARRAGLFEFNLRTLLERYVGDVQVFTEFEMFRHIILARFHSALASIHEQHEQARLHIVAHSEGTVVAFLGLLLAMAGECWAIDSKANRPSAKKANESPAWLPQVHGLMTLGSPIDKHLTLWPELFDGFGLLDREQTPRTQQIKWDLSQAQRTWRDTPIKWRNYYDYGDPVGFKLDAVRSWFRELGFTAFEFEAKHDYGYARYLLPGKAHNDYWIDSQVFEHYLLDVIHGSALQKPVAPFATAQASRTTDAKAATPSAPSADAELNPSPPRPRSRKLVAFLSPTLPYLLSFVLLFAGCTLLQRAVLQFTHPAPDSLQTYVRYTLFGESVKPHGAIWEILMESLGIALLVAGCTLFARWPRIARAPRWRFAGGFAFILGCWGYVLLVPLAARIEIGALFSRLPCPTLLDGNLAHHLGLPHCSVGGSATWYVLATALVVALIGMLGCIPPASSVALRRTKLNRGPYSSFANALLDVIGQKRRARWFIQGMRPLIISGGLALGAIIGYQMMHPVGELSEANHQYLKTKYANGRIRQLERTLPRPLPDTMVETAPGVQPQGDRVKAVEALLKPNPSTWPVLLAGAACLYLWWLAALVFDLSFVWHRYVRRSVMNDTLRRWRWPDARS